MTDLHGADDEVRVEPAPTTNPQAAQLPQVQVHKTVSRERMRSFIAFAVLGATLVVGATYIVALLSDSAHARGILTAIFTPLVALSGTIVGFYFGGQDTTA